MSEPRAFDVLVEEGIGVTLPSGETYMVLTQSERDYLADRVKRYLADNRFVNVTDMADVDKVVVLELLIHRFTLWVGKGRDYWDEDINVLSYTSKVSELSGEVRQLKKSLGLDKATRDRTQGEDSVDARWANLKERAKEFGYARNETYNKIIEAFKRVEGMIIFHDRCDELERKEQHCEIEDVMEVLRAAIEEVSAVDEEFRMTQQKMWIKKQ